MTGRPLFLLLLTSFLVLPSLLCAQPQHCRDGLDANDPRHPEVICLPELGRMIPTTSPCVSQFGQQIVPLGDIDGDSLADWIIQQVRCDTSDDYPHYPEEAVLYHGSRGRLPVQNSGVRIGPTEILSSSSVISAGDWDGDSNVDLAVRVKVYGDTSDGVHPGDAWSTMVIFWGNASGSYDSSDTTRLSCDATGWYGWDNGISMDADNDGIADLMLFGWYGYGLQNGVEIPVPKMLLFRGHRGARWGRDGIARTADWRWWNPPPLTTLGSGDQDNDGYPDIFLYANDFPSHLTILYGTSTAGLPDTSNLESADLASIGARTSLLMDVTGDHIPELVVTNSQRNLLRIYVGLKGQRIAQQFGIEPPHPGEKQWWGKPWAEIWEPGKFGGSWPASYDLLYDLGDIDLDGTGDIASYNSPWLTFYRGGIALDSLIDAMVDTRAVGGTLSDEHPTAVALLGDIDGSGVPTIAVSSTGVLYVKPSHDVPQSGIYRMIPDGTGPAAVEPENTEEHTSLYVTALPNPAHHDVRIEWRGADLYGEANISISNLSGQTITQLAVPADTGMFYLTTDNYAAGEYFITLRIGLRHSTIPLVLQ